MVAFFVEVDAEGIDAEGKPWGFCNVMTSSLDKRLVQHVVAKLVEIDALLERRIIKQILSSLYTSRKIYISGGCNSNNVRVFVEGLEGNGVVNLASWLARVIEMNELRRI